MKGSALISQGLFLYFLDFKQNVQIDEWEQYKENPPDPIDKFIGRAILEEYVGQQTDHKYVHRYGNYFHVLYFLRL